MVELYGLKPNGQPINSNPYSKHSDGDGLEDNEELHFSREKMTYELDKSQYDGSVFVWSDPCLDDTDGDGINDNKDANKLHVYDNRFINTSKKTECNTNDSIDKKIQEANKAYNTKSNVNKFFLYEYYSQIIDRSILHHIACINY